MICADCSRVKPFSVTMRPESGTQRVYVLTEEAYTPGSAARAALRHMADDGVFSLIVADVRRISGSSKCCCGLGPTP